MSGNVFDNNTDSDYHNNKALQPEPQNSLDTAPTNDDNPEQENFADRNKPLQSPIQPVGDEELIDSFMGLPIGWQERNIPTGEQIFEATKRAFERVKKHLNNDQVILSPAKLEAHAEIIKQASDFSSLLLDSVDLALSLKDRFFGAACLKQWKGLLACLLCKATNYDADMDIKSDMLTRIMLELGALSNFQSNSQSAITKLKHAIDFTLNKSCVDEASLLLAQIEYFHATSLQMPLDEIPVKAHELLGKAKIQGDVYAQMRIYMSLSYVYGYQYGDLKKGFAYGQQALVLAYVTQKLQNTLLALTLMTPAIFNNPSLSTYRRKILSFWYQSISSNPYNIRLYALYLGQLSPYLYRHKKYHSAQKYYLQSIDLYQSMGDTENMVRMIHGLGMTYTQLCQWDKAQHCFDRALRIYKELQQITNQVWIQHCIGWLHIKRGDTDQGIDMLQIAYEAAKHLPLDIQRRERLINGIKGDLDDAMSSKSQLSSVVT